MDYIPHDFHHEIKEVKEEVVKLARVAKKKGFDDKDTAKWSERMGSTFKLDDIRGAWEVFAKDSANAHWLQQRLAKVHEAISGGSSNSLAGTLPAAESLLREMQVYHQINADRIYSNSLGHSSFISRRIAQLYQVPTLASRDSHIRII